MNFIFLEYEFLFLTLIHETFILGVLDVAVIGVQDDRAGEVPKAFIVPATDEVTAKKINDFLSDKLAKYKKLTGGIVLLKELPKSPTGKVLRKELRKM